MNDYLQKIALRELKLLLLGGAAIVTAVALVLVVAPNAKALNAATQQVRLLSQARTSDSDLKRHIDESLEQITATRRALHGDMAGLPPRQVEAFVVGQLQRVSWRNEVELISVEPAVGERYQMFQETLFRVQLVGEYDDLYRWLIDTRNDLGYVLVKEYELRRHDEDDREPLLRADLSLAAYRVTE